MTKFLKSHPLARIIDAKVSIPSSKPETQRAIVTGALATGKSTVYGDLRCSETLATKIAMRAIGAEIVELPDRLEITGVEGRPNPRTNVIDCHGSGFAFRVMTSLCALAPGAQIVTGDSILQKRLMHPLFDALHCLGAEIEFLGKPGFAPVSVNSAALGGGSCSVPGDTCSQFTTALLLALPLAQAPVTLNVTGQIASASYVQQTLDAMSRAGVDLNTRLPASTYEIKPSSYRNFTVEVGGDFTSASYLVAIASLFPCTIKLAGVRSFSLQGERAIIDIVKALGVHVEFDDVNAVCTISNDSGKLRGDFSFDVKNCPNILPTLAAMGAFIDGSLTVTGGSVTNYHKSPRIRAMIEELRKFGVDITPCHTDSGILDGFTIRGKSHYEGGLSLSSWGDHRIFLSLFVASLRCARPNLLDGYEGVHNSFPDFFEQVAALGIHFEETTVKSNSGLVAA